MNETKLYITEERFKRLETGVDLLINPIDEDQYNLIYVKALSFVVCQIVSLHNVVGTKFRLLTSYVHLCLIKSKLVCPSGHYDCNSS